MDNFKFKILPSEWIKSYNILRILTDLSNYKSLKIILLAVLVTLLEAISLTLIMPLLKLISSGSELVVADSNNHITNTVILVLNYVGFPVKFASISILIGVIVLIRQYLNFILSKYLAKIRANNNKTLRKKIFKATFLSKPSNIEDLGTGSYVELMANQSGKASVYLVHVIKYFSILLLCFFYVALAFAITPMITLIAILLAVFILIFANRIISKIKTITANNVRDLKYFSKYLSECFSSWRVIKLANSYDYENKRNEKWINQIADQDYQVELNMAKTTLYITLVIMTLLLFVLNIGVNITNIELSILVIFSIMCLRLIPIILSIVAYQTRITVSAESLNRIFQVLNDLKNNQEIDIGKKNITVKDGIIFDNLAFKYPGSNNYVFKNFNEKIPFEKVTTISGKSGSGKSTLLDLITRIYDMYDGEIKVDGISIRDISLINYRNNISLLSQNPFVFDDSVLSNISYGNADLKNNDIINAAKLANAHDFITKLSDGYNTILGERGSKLSGGQIQRIVLARILASKAKIIILDEPTSSLDKVASEKIIDALINIKNTSKYTLIIVSHSKRIIELGDKIINID
tara:strand:- start:26282 stop:28018 length:1737 start_codon:yes stop_codon:yes gene_type:complete